MASVKPIIAIVGSTASGKTAAALSIASQVAAEIICSDARTIYIGMDIGTAKPTRTERSTVPHHMLDIITPDVRYSAADFTHRAGGILQEIANRGNVPIVVGGTGLYVDALAYSFEFRTPANVALRQSLAGLSVPELQLRIAEAGLVLPRNDQNPRHLVRTLETAGAIAHKSDLRAGMRLFGLRVGRETLSQRIAHRLDMMVGDGSLQAEVEGLADRYGWEAPGLQTIGYVQWKAYFAGTQSLEQTIELIHIATRQYAKRQETWFKRNPDITWFDDPNTLTAHVVDLLNKNT